MQDTNDTAVIKLHASVGSRAPARLSFPALFKPKAFEGGKPRYSATFILDRVQNADDIKRISAAIESVRKAKWGTKQVHLLGTCLKDGSSKAHLDGYGDKVMFLTSSSDGEKQPPGVVDQRLQPLNESDGKPYAGCYVYFVARVWAQDNKYGKRINCALQNVQFVKHGDPFGEKVPSASEAFEEIPEDAAQDI